MKIIVTGHGNFATGMESTVKLLAGEIPNVQYIDFTADLSEEALLKKFPQENNVLFFCDLAGGTPYKQAAILSSQYENIAVIAGGNIGALLEVGLQNDLSRFENAQALADLLLTASHAGIQKFQIQKYIEEIEEDGI